MRYGGIWEPAAPSTMEVMAEHYVETRPATGYKRKNVRDGPIRMNPNITFRKRASDEKDIRTNKENEGTSASEKKKGKQKARDSEDEIEETMKKTE